MKLILRGSVRATIARGRLFAEGDIDSRVNDREIEIFSNSSISISNGTFGNNIVGNCIIMNGGRIIVDGVELKPNQQSNKSISSKKIDILLKNAFKKIDVSGACTLGVEDVLNLCDSVSFQCSGSCDVFIQHGKLEKIQAHCSGSCNFIGLDLVVHDFDVHASGASHCENFHILDSCDLYASGASDVYVTCSDFCQISKSSSGASIIKVSVKKITTTSPKKTFVPEIEQKTSPPVVPQIEKKVFVTKEKKEEMTQFAELYEID